MIKPTTIAPASEPSSAPTIPPQKRSGRKIVKCQIASPIITQPSIPISGSLAPSRARRPPSARPAVTAVAGSPALLAPFRLVLEHQILRRGVRWPVALLGRVRFGRGGSPRHAGGARCRLALHVQVTHEFLELVP